MYLPSSKKTWNLKGGRKISPILDLEPPLGADTSATEEKKGGWVGCRLGREAQFVVGNGVGGRGGGIIVGRPCGVALLRGGFWFGTKNEFVWEGESTRGRWGSDTIGRRTNER